MTLTAFQPNAFQANPLAFQIATNAGGGGGAWFPPYPREEKDKIEELFDDEISALLLCS
jgi:hypothetical protein